jgi:hypothetical protein
VKIQRVLKGLLPFLALLASVVLAASCKSHSAQSAERSRAAEAKASVAATAAVSAPATPVAPKRSGDPSSELNPFGRYLDDAKNNWPEPALVRFASACGIDVDRAAARFAQRPGDKWLPVKDLSNAQADQETDFYHTLAVWHRGDLALTEEWGMELDTGDYYRIFTCLNHLKITSAESVSWSISEDEENPSPSQAWGYDVLWTISPKGDLTIASKKFVDLREKPMAEPALDAETRKGLEAQGFTMRSWSDLEYPSAMLE